MASGAGGREAAWRCSGGGGGGRGTGRAASGCWVLQRDSGAASAMVRCRRQLGRIPTLATQAAAPLQRPPTGSRCIEWQRRHCWPAVWADTRPSRNLRPPEAPCGLEPGSPAAWAGRGGAQIVSRGVSGGGGQRWERASHPTPKYRVSPVVHCTACASRCGTPWRWQRVGAQNWRGPESRLGDHRADIA